MRVLTHAPQPPRWLFYPPTEGNNAPGNITVVVLTEPIVAEEPTSVMEMMNEGLSTAPAPFFPQRSRLFLEQQLKPISIAQCAVLFYHLRQASGHRTDDGAAGSGPEMEQ